MQMIVFWFKFHWNLFQWIKTNIDGENGLPLNKGRAMISVHHIKLAIVTISIVGNELRLAISDIF